jgi:hypothetical protein
MLVLQESCPRKDTIKRKIKTTRDTLPTRASHLLNLDGAHFGSYELAFENLG